MSTAVKEAVRKRDSHRCVDCGLTDEQHQRKYGRNLDVHRLLPGCVYSLEHCVTLCKSCHAARHVAGIDTTGLEYERQNPRPPRAVFHIPQELRDALTAYRDSLRLRPSESEILRTALELFLETKRFWPPPEDDSDT